MTDYERIERDLMVQVSLRHRPVAVTTLKAAPPGVEKFEGVQEAATRSGVAAQLSTLGRPTCMVVPAALEHEVVASTGCVGNRVYTGLDETDLYVAVPGRDLLKVAGEIATITMANNTLLMYHQDRKRQLAGVDRR